MSDKTKGSLAGLAGNVIFGFSFLFSKTVLQTGVHPLTVLSVRFLLAFLFMNLLLLFGRVRLDIHKKQILPLLLMAICQPVVYFIGELYGISMVPTAVSGVIIATVPAFVMLASSLFLKEKPTVLQAAFAGVSFVCVALIALFGTENQTFSLMGIFILLTAVLSATMFNLLSRKLSATVSPFSRTYMMFAVAAVCYAVLAPALLGADYLKEVAAVLSDRNAFLSLLYLSAVSSVVAFFCINYCIKKAGLIRSSSFSSIITVISVPAGILLLHETLSVAELCLCVVITVCVYFINRFGKG